MYARWEYAGHAEMEETQNRSDFPGERNYSKQILLLNNLFKVVRILIITHSGRAIRP
jgi:hypothetical protein